MLWHFVKLESHKNKITVDLKIFQTTILRTKYQQQQYILTLTGSGYTETSTTHADDVLIICICAV
jgi:hypothetical protein